jgi:hypothetical protein
VAEDRTATITTTTTLTAVLIHVDVRTYFSRLRTLAILFPMAAEQELGLRAVLRPTMGASAMLVPAAAAG